MGYPIFDYGLEPLAGFTPTTNLYVDVPVSNLTNGMCPLTANQVPLYGGYNFAVQALGTDDRSGDIIYPPNGDFGSYRGRPDSQIANIPFLDGTTHIAQNISFLLRVSQTNNPLIFSSFTPWQIGNPNPSPDYVYPGQPNYVFSGFHYPKDPDNEGLNEFQPFEENKVYQNFCYASDAVGADNYLQTGPSECEYFFIDHTGSFVDVATGYWLGSPSNMFDTLGFVNGYSTLPLPSLSANNSDWIYSPQSGPLSWQGLGIASNDINNLYLLNNVSNFYGLQLLSIKWPGASVPATFPTATPGQIIDGRVPGSHFTQTAQPIMQTVGYYFARPGIDALPGEIAFAVTNITPDPIIVPFAQPFAINGWAKQIVSNAYPGVYAFPEQYFDKAFTTDTNGNITTNQTGVLSEYGELFPTAPGKIMLTTKPDGATGTTGQVTVYAIKLQLNVNHDGTMDTSFAGPDNTSADRPFKFWVNNGRTVSSGLSDTGHEVDSPNTPNFASGTINCTRDLENFARLWIVGLPALNPAWLPLSSNGYVVTLSWANVTAGSPSIESLRFGRDERGDRLFDGHQHRHGTNQPRRLHAARRRHRHRHQRFNPQLAGIADSGGRHAVLVV